MILNAWKLPSFPPPLGFSRVIFPKLPSLQICWWCVHWFIRLSGIAVNSHRPSGSSSGNCSLQRSRGNSWSNVWNMWNNKILSARNGNSFLFLITKKGVCMCMCTLASCARGQAPASWRSRCWWRNCQWTKPARAGFYKSLHVLRLSVISLNRIQWYISARSSWNLWGQRRMKLSEGRAFSCTSEKGQAVVEWAQNGQRWATLLTGRKMERGF